MYIENKDYPTFFKEVAKPVSEYNEVLEKLNATTVKGTDIATMIAILFSARLYTGMTKRDKTEDVVIIAEQDNKR